MWIQKFLASLFDLKLEVTFIFCDNQICINLFENPVFHDKPNNVEIEYHYIWDMVQRGDVKLQYFVIDEQIADVLTKPLARVKFEYFRDKIGVVQNNFPTWEEVLSYICDSRGHSTLSVET